MFASLIAAAIAVIISAVLQAALTRGAALASVGDPVDTEASYQYGFKKFGSVLWISILVGLVVGIGFILLIIPGIIFLTMLAVTIPALIVEDQRGTAAMGRSWNLVKGHFWHVLGTIVVAALITGVVGAILGLLGGSNWFLQWIFGSIAQIITAPFAALVTVLLYVDLRVRNEQLTGERLRSELSSTRGLRPAPRVSEGALRGALGVRWGWARSRGVGASRDGDAADHDLPRRAGAPRPLPGARTARPGRQAVRVGRRPRRLAGARERDRGGRRTGCGRARRTRTAPSP